MQWATDTLTHVAPPPGAPIAPHTPTRHTPHATPPPIHAYPCARDAGSNYDLNAKVLDTQTNIDRPPTAVFNVNQQEIRHNGVDKYTGVDRG